MIARIEHNDSNDSPEAFEARKTKQERAEDIAYTINHALACTLTDFIDPYVGNWTQDYLGKRISIGCGHDHSGDGAYHAHSVTCNHVLPIIDGGHDDPSHGFSCKPAGEHVHGPGCNHNKPLIDLGTGDHTPPPAPEPHVHSASCNHDHHHDHPPAPKSQLKHWIIGEFVGDFGAVPVTIAFQRFAPGLMDNIRHVAEPILGGAFRLGAKFSARSWANKEHVATDSQACKDKENEIYEHEVRHLPQAVVWTAASIGINLATQRVLGNNAPLWQLAAAKATGASISAAAVVTGRAFAPQTARKWDQFTSKNLFLPATKALGGLAGISSEDVDRMAQKEDHTYDSWADKVQKPATEQAVSANRG